LKKGETVKTTVTTKEQPKKDNKRKKRINGSPIFECRDNKWVVQNQDSNNNISIQVESPKQVIYISQCDNTFITVQGKFNTITLDDCQKCSISFENAVASCDIINCKSVKVEVRGSVPTVLIDKSDGAHVFLSKSSFDTSIFTSKSSELNVSVAISNDEYKEMAIPEQFISKYDPQTGKLNTTLNSHVG